MESRYGTSADYASSRGVHCMEYLDGRIYIGGGNWDDNSEGRIWTRATDPKEGNPNYG